MEVEKFIFNNEEDSELELEIVDAKSRKDIKDLSSSITKTIEANVARLIDTYFNSLPTQLVSSTTFNNALKDLNDKIQNANINSILYKINEGINVVDSQLVYSKGVVEIRQIGDIIWIIDSGVYNLTPDFTTKKNRTVLEFNLPKSISNRLPNTQNVFGTTGTITYFPALAYENITYTTFNCQSYIKRSSLGEEYDTFQLVYTGLNSITGGGLCGFHSKIPLILSNNTN